MSSALASRSIIRALVPTLARLVLPLWCLLAPVVLFADFGLTVDPTFYTVDTDAGLVFKVRRVDLGVSTQSPGDLASLVYNGVEYQNQIRGSHINSGFDWLYNGVSASTVAAETIGTDIVKVTVSAGNLTHYYIARRGDANIYMGTHFSSEPNVHGLVRYIMRIPNELLPDGPVPSDVRNTTGAIESADIFGLANGETRSKHYSNMRQMDWGYIGASGPNVGVWMVKGNEEGMSGGPFYRCLIAQTGGDQEVYAMLNYGEAQTDIFRPGTLNLYTYVFNNGTAPATPDLSWLDGLNLLGWMPASGRGSVSGTATGVPAAFQAVVGFSNATAQYWATVDNGGFTCAGMIPGTYKATLFKGELEVAVQQDVVVTAGGPTPLSLASTEATPSVIFRIGEWDGTPAGFMNADKLTVMHPTDVRMTPWGPITYTVGVDDLILFPSAEFRLKNSPTTIKFNLAPNQVADLTFRIGITCNYAGGRPVIAVNNTWNSSIPAAPSQPGTRTITVGTYRGNNNLFSWTIPASALVAGTNTLTITPVSGTSDIGAFLSASYVFDAVELDGPIATPAITYVGSDPLVVSGTAEPGRTVAITLDGSTPAGTAVVAANGIWSIVVAGALADGPHSFTAMASDAFGHNSPVSAAYAFQSGLTMPTIASAIGDTGTYTSGAVTSDRVFEFIGTAAPGATVALTRTGVGVIGTAITDGSGVWTYDYSTVSLPDGAHTFFATANDGGQASPSSPPFTLTLTGAPRVAIQRLNPTQQIIPSDVGSVVFRVAFNHPVSGVAPAAFSLTTTDTATGTVANVSADSGTTFDITVNVSGVGTLRLNLAAGSSIVDAQGNVEAAYNAGQAYTLVLASTGSGAWIQPVSGGLWSDPSNWNNAVVADGAANIADFSTLDLSADIAVQLDSSRTINRVIFGDTATSSPANWLLSANGPANTLTLAGSAPTITVNGVTGGTGTAYGLNGTIARVGAGLAGTGGLIKNGAGTLVLEKANSLTGALNLSAGYIEVPATGALNLGNGAVNVTTNTRLQVSGGVVATTGLVTVNTGSIVVDGGTVAMGSYRTAGNFGATLRINAGTVSTGAISVTRNAGTSPDYNTGVVVKGGTLTATDIGLGTLNSYGNMSVEGGLVTATGVITLGNQQTGGRGGALRVTGGTLISTDTSYGVLMSRNNGANTNNVAQAIFTGGVSSIEKFTLGYDAAVTAGSATITINGGTLFLGSGGIVKNGAATMVTNLNFSSGVLGAKANWSTALPVNLPTNGNITFRAADAAEEPFDISLNGVVGGAGGFTKAGAGMLTLDGNGVTHTFAGPVTVNAGILRVTGSLGAAVNGLTINSGAALTGNGTINRLITLNDGGTIAPDGATPAAMLAAASLTWNAGGVLAFDVGATSDRLTLTGALTKGGTGSYVFQLMPDATVAPGSYTLATFGSTTFADTDFTAAGLPAGLAGRFIVTANELQLIVYGPPVFTGPASANGVLGAPFSYPIEATENPPTGYSATGLPSGLTLDANTGVISGAPTVVGQFEVTLGATNAAGSTQAALGLNIAPALATVVLGELSPVYDGLPKPVSVVTIPAGLPVTVTYDGSSSAPTDAGSYAIVATVLHPHFIGGASDTLVVAKATPTIVLGQLAQTYDGAPKPVTATVTPAGLPVTVTYDGGATAPIGVGSYAVVATVNEPNYAGSVDDTLVIAKATASIVLAPLQQVYDGTAKSVTATTVPAGLDVDITYDGSADAPVYPGAYEVVATVDDANYTATATDTFFIRSTALVRHAPVVSGTIEGSMQVSSAETISLSGNATVTGDLLVPGMPGVQSGSNVVFVGVLDGPGGAAPSNYGVTLSGNALLRYLVRRIDPLVIPAVSAPPAPAGTRNVALTKTNQSAGDFATVRNLSLSGNAGIVSVPPGTYGSFTAGGNSGFSLGVAGATAPAVYHLQDLGINLQSGNAKLQIVGPVIITVANGTVINGLAGSAAHPEWLTLRIAGGGLTIAGGTFHGDVVAPNGAVTLEDAATLNGAVVSDQLTLDGSSILNDPEL
jgi:rhamnogalacturonan endolyase